MRFDLRVAKQTSRKQLEAKQDLHAFRIETRENHMSGPTHTNTHTHTDTHTHKLSPGNVRQILASITRSVMP